MNFLGTAFSFGKIIKAFLPGFIYTLGLMYIFHLYNDLVFIVTENKNSALMSFINDIYKQPALITFLIILLSLISGLISNVILYARNDTVLRKPYEEDSIHKSILEVEGKVEKYIINKLIPGDIKVKDEKLIDLQSFLLPHTDLIKLNFVLESYWYFLEFIRNLNAAMYFIAGLMFLDTILAAIEYAKIPDSNTCGERTLIIIPAILLVILAYKLKDSVMRNYRSHRKKMLNLHIGTIMYIEMEKNKK